MNSNQALSIEQMQRLIELGVDTSKARVFFTPKLGPKREYAFFDVEPCAILTFTLQDILEMLPKQIFLTPGKFNLMVYFFKEWEISYSRDGRYIAKLFDDSLLNCAYNMLVWVAENGYLKGGTQ